MEVKKTRIKSCETVPLTIGIEKSSPSQQAGGPWPTLSFFGKCENLPPDGHVCIFCQVLWLYTGPPILLTPPHILANSTDTHLNLSMIQLSNFEHFTLYVDKMKNCVEGADLSQGGDEVKF